MLGKATRIVVDAGTKEEDWCWEGVHGHEEEDTATSLCPEDDARTPSNTEAGSRTRLDGGVQSSTERGDVVMFGRRGIFGKTSCPMEQSCVRLSDEYDPYGGLMSPVPRNTWQNLDGEIVEAGESEVLRGWLNAVLCPWDGGRASIETSVEIYMHQDVLQARMVRQWDNKREGIFEPVDRVGKSLGRDVIRLAMDVEEVMSTAVLKTKVQQGFASYSRAWLEIAHKMVKEMYGGLSEREEQYVRVIMQLSGKRTGGKIPPSGYLRVVCHILGVILLLDDIFSSHAGGWKVPVWAPLLFSRRGHLGVHASHHVVQSAMGTLLKKVDMERYLRRFGYSVSYVQSPRLCVRLSVENLSVDLRDGVRLCRLADVLCAEQEHALHPRYPCSKRSDRIKNISSAMDRLGFDDTIAPQIADGEYTATTSLLWDCIIMHEVPRSLNTRSIHVECDLIAGSAVSMSEVDAAVDSLRSHMQHETIQKNESVGVLLRWLCCLCVSENNTLLGDIFSNIKERQRALESIASYYGKAHSSAVQCTKRARTGPFETLNKVLRASGGVPVVLRESEYFGDADCRRLVVFYAVLCKRVMSVQYEQRAATVIQRFWRRVRHRKPGYARNNLDAWIQAAIVIQRNVRPYLFRRRVELSAPLRQQMVERISHLQAIWRGKMQRAEFLRLNHSVLVIQSVWRGFFQRTRYKALRDRMDLEEWAAIRIQSHWRGHVCRAAYSEWQSASVCIQRFWRMVHHRAMFVSMRESANVIQMHMRRRLAQQAARERMSAIVQIQVTWRRHIAQQHFDDVRRSAVVIQKHIRSHQAKKRAEDRLRAIVVIQRYFKAHRQEQIEAMSRTLREQTNALYDTMYEYSHRIAAAMRIQRGWREYVTTREQARRARMLREHMERAAVVMQSAVRGHRARKKFIAYKNACLDIQNAWRKHRRYEEMKENLTSLYAAAKAGVALRMKHEHAAVLIQAYFRAHYVRVHHPLSVQLGSIRGRLCEATARTQALKDEGLQDPTSLHCITENALEMMCGGSVLPQLEVLEYLSRCLYSSCACCEMFIRKNGVGMLVKAIASTLRDQTRRDSMCEGFKCIQHVCACGRYVDNVGDILIKNGSLETLASLLFQIREHQACFHSLVEMLITLTSSAKFCSGVTSIQDTVEKLQGAHRAICMKHSQVSAYLTRLEGQKGSDVSAANATKTLFKLKRQITVLEDLLAKLRIQGSQATRSRVDNQTIQGKNTIVRQALAEIKNVGRT